MTASTSGKNLPNDDTKRGSVKMCGYGCVGHTTDEHDITSTSGVTATIQSRLDAATPGPWFKKLNDLLGGVCVMPLDLTPANAPIEVHEVADFVQPADAEFIAHAPEDIAFLLAENARLSARVSVLETERDSMDEHLGQLQLDIEGHEAASEVLARHIEIGHNRIRILEGERESLWLAGANAGYNAKEFNEGFPANPFAALNESEEEN